jgi:tetratricopeptide (TPR) repeat protein
MSNLYKFLSGNIPGGLFVLIFALVIVNLATYLLFKKSGLFEGSVYKRRTIPLNVLVILLYFLFWIVLQPQQLPETVLVQPMQNGDSIDVTISELLEQSLNGNLSTKYRLHPWEWFYLTADKDSIDEPEYRQRLSKKLDIDVIVAGDIQGDMNNLNLNCTIEYDKKLIRVNPQNVSFREAGQEILRQLGSQTNILRNKTVTAAVEPGMDYAKYTRAKLAYLNGQYDLPLQLLNEDTLYAYRLMMSRALLKTALEQEQGKKSPAREAEEEHNPFFRRMERLLKPYSIKGVDTAELNSILGQMYLFRKDYEMADICLKKALSQNRYDARVYYYLSFLDIERLKELRYSDRIDILRQAVRLDPGFSECIFRLASDVYNRGSGTSVARTTYEAIDIMENYLKLNANTVSILRLLGKIYLQIKDLPRAAALFEKVITLQPDSAESYYDLGVCYFDDQKYDLAQRYLEQAIKIGDHRESYLYLGAVYYVKGDFQKALYYYRERIKRKTNDDDYYALEAMRGVRTILARLQGDSTGGNNQESIPPLSLPAHK